MTCSAGVPTIWLGLAQHMEQTRPDALDDDAHGRRRLGDAAKRMIRTWTQRFGVEVRHAWGMTETSPVGTRARCCRSTRDSPVEQQCAQRAKQGRAVFGVEMRIVDADGREQPRDGKSRSGELVVRGPWIARRVLQEARQPALRDGWFPTGDIATIDADGYMQITDRVKDVIKSGGEWISSIDLENAAAGHPAVLMAAVIGARHPKWDERPVMFVVKKPGHDRRQGRDPRLARGQGGEVVAARRGDFPRRPAARRDRQGAEDGIAAPVRGRAGLRGLMRLFARTCNEAAATEAGTRPAHQWTRKKT